MGDGEPSARRDTSTLAVRDERLPDSAGSVVDLLHAPPPALRNALDGVVDLACTITGLDGAAVCIVGSTGELHQLTARGAQGDGCLDGVCAAAVETGGFVHRSSGAAAPLLGDDGQVLGALCVTGPNCGLLRPEQLRSLELLARQVMTHLELLRSSRQLSGDKRLVEQQRAELTAVLSALETSQARFRLAFDNSPLGMAITSLAPADAGVMVQVNDALCALTGYSKTELQGMPVSALHHPEDRARARKVLDELTSGVTDSAEGELRYRHAQGHVVWVRLRTAVMRTDDGSEEYVVSQVEDITARRAAKRALAESEQRFRAQFTHSALGQIIQRPDGTLAEVNPAFATMLGYRPEELAGWRLRDLVASVDPDRTERSLFATLLADEDSTAARELRLRHRGGGVIDVRADISAVREPDGSIHHFIGLLTDVSSRKAAERERDAAARQLARRNAELQASNSELAAANELKLDLISMLSHEIGGPLTAILGHVELALDPRCTPTMQQTSLQTISRSARDLVRMRDEILTMCAMDAGRLEANPEPVDLASAIAKAARATASPLQVDGADGVTALASPSHVQHILVNYLSNAGKYAGGATRIEVRRLPSQVEIRVVDEGPGVPADLQPRLFDRFTRGGDETSRKLGTGLGLYIVRGLAQANGGAAWYEPNEPAGSVFAVRLPVLPVLSGAGPSSRPPALDSSLNREINPERVLDAGAAPAEPKPAW